MRHVTTTEGEQKYSISIDFFKFGLTPLLNAYAYPRFLYIIFSVYDCFPAIKPRNNDFIYIEFTPWKLLERVK